MRDIEYTVQKVLSTLEIEDKCSIYDVLNNPGVIREYFNTSGLWVFAKEFMLLNKTVTIVNNAIEDCAEEGIMYLDCPLLSEEIEEDCNVLTSLYWILKELEYKDDED